MKNSAGRSPLSPGLTRLAEAIIADDPNFVPLEPGQHRSPDYYLVEHYFGVARGPKRSKDRPSLLYWLGRKLG